MFSKTVGIANLLTLLKLVSAGQDEMVILANCVNNNNGNDQSSQIAYYSHSTDGSPAAIAKVQTQPGKTAWWEGGTPISATFADGNTFSADIPKDINVQGAFVGVGKNNGGTFSCWRSWRPNTYSRDGVTCSGIYECDHRSLPGNEIDVHIGLGSGSVAIDGDINTGDLFHTIWDRRQINWCDKTPVNIPGTGCSITYDCFGADDWTITNAMASTVNGPLAKAVKQLQTWRQKECIETSEVPPHKCVDWEFVTHQRTHIVNHARLDVTNVSPSGSGIPNSLAGWLTYDLSCPSSGPNCAGCKAAELTLMGGAAAGGLTGNPEVSAAFGAANVFTSAVCALIGC